MQFRDFPHDRNGPSRNRQDARRAVPLGPQNAPSRDLASPRKTIHGSCQQQDGMRRLLLGQQHHASTGFKNRSPPESGRVTQAGTRRQGNRRRAVAKLQASAANGMNRPLVPGSRRLSGESQKTANARLAAVTIERLAAGHTARQHLAPFYRSASSSHSASFDHRLFAPAPFTAIASAFF